MCIRDSFKRNKDGIPAKVATIEYDPNRSANIALLHYADGEKRYIIAPFGLKVGETVVSGENADIKVGNALPIRNIPVGTMVHCIELLPGKGAQLVRSAGNAAQLLAKENKYAQVRLPSGEVRLIPLGCKATIGQVGNIDSVNIKLGKAGRTRHMGVRPTVRGSVMNPNDHPHGGGEGKSPIGRPGPVTPWGKPALGYKTRKTKNINDKYYIIAPFGLKVGETVVSGENADIKVGNALPIRNIPVGTMVHCIELLPGKGAQLVRSAGNAAQLLAKENKYAQVRLPSGEVRLIPLGCKATIGQVGNIDSVNIKLGKAGRTRHMGVRPTVRGSVMNPNDHPHGGGEGKSPIGRPGPVTPWGKPALGYKTRKTKNINDKYIVRRRDGK